MLGCGTAPPAPTVPTVEGETIDFNQLRGKWVVLNYWASWCRPCYQEIPALNALAHEHADQVVVLGVSFDQVASTQALIPIIQQLGIEFPILAINPAAQLGISSIPALPATFIFDPQGHQVAQLFGEQTQESLLAVVQK